MTDLAALKRSIDLAALIRSYGIELSKQGSKLFAHCPFHDDSTPSFSIYTKAGLQRCGCKGCGFDGDVFDFIGKREGILIKDAIERAKAFAGGSWEVPLPVNGTGPGHAKAKHKTKPGKILAEYDYLDTAGELRYQVLRRETLDAETGKVLNNKFFTQRQPDAAGFGWNNSMAGVARVLYRLPQVLAASEVWLVEGEKDVHTLEACGAIATTDSGGALNSIKHWQPSFTEALSGKRVIICGDSDAPGRARDAAIAGFLQGCAEIRIVRLPEYNPEDPCPIKDVTDWIDAGRTVEELLAMAEPYPAPAASAPPDEPPPPEPRVIVESGNEDWQSLLLINYRERTPRGCSENVCIALRYAPEWKDVLWYNEFTQGVVARKPFPENKTEETNWKDTHDTCLLNWLCHQGIYVSPETVIRAVEFVAHDHPYHPIREYLNGLQWDAMPRLDHWLVEYLGVEPNNYVSAVGPLWMISAVARVFQPGCKADCCLILEGSQGQKKSLALEKLAVKTEWFADRIAALGTKDAGVDVQGVWIIEMGELEGFNKAETTLVKSFMSASKDRFRPPYGRRTRDFPRQCIFAATTNHETYLKDETGARRFWPVRCDNIAIDAIHADRDQLWAEAVYRYRDGAKWWIEDASILADSVKQQSSRFETDPWHGKLSEWLAAKNDISIAQILEFCISKPIKDWTQQDRNRVGRILRMLNWQLYRTTDDERRYRAPFHTKPEF